MGRNKDTSENKKDRFFSLKLNFVETEEHFSLKKVFSEMKIKELKGHIEFAAGIPFHIQRLYYLDEGDLQDNTDIKTNDIVHGAKLNLRVWPMWRTLIEAVASNDIEWLFQLGVTQDSTYRTPNSDFMYRRQRQKWFAERAAVALYMAAHRGFIPMCQQLIKAGADVNAKTGLGRTALHVAAAQGKGGVMDLLLKKGANINETDEEGHNALTIAAKYGHKDCERHLFLFRWQQRAKESVVSYEPQCMAHQYFDSTFPVWLSGPLGQIYFTQILPLGEFEGTAFHSPKRRPRPGERGANMQQESTDEDSENDDSDHPRENTMVSFKLDSDGRMSSIPEVDSKDSSGKPRNKHERKSKNYGDKAKTFEDWLKKKEIQQAQERQMKKHEEEQKRLEAEQIKLQRLLRIKQRERERGASTDSPSEDHPLSLFDQGFGLLEGMYNIDPQLLMQKS